MFTKPIHATTLTDTAADRLFSNIAVSGAPDQSFAATLRALLRKRLPQDETMHLSCRGLSLSESEMTISAVFQRVPELIQRRPSPSEHTVFIVYAHYPAAGAKMLEALRATVGTSKRYLGGYTLRENLRVFYKLRICAAYTADMRAGLNPRRSYSFPPESHTYLPNPHIQAHGCIGSYYQRFQEYMQRKDYVGAIDQAVVSARSLNFYDSTVMATFAHSLSGSGLYCIEKPDGTLLMPREAISELEEGDMGCQGPS